MKIIVVNGPPCSGKTTVLQEITRKYECPMFSLGEFVKEVSKTNAEIRKYRESGKVKSIPEYLLVPLVREYFEHLQKENHKLCLFQRGPWCKKLASVFEDSGLHVDLFVHINVKDDTLFERIKYRRIDPLTSKVYNIKEYRPKEEILKRLRVKLGDDKYLFRRRLCRYKKSTGDLMEFYRKRGRFRSIDGNKEKVEVTKDFLRVIDCVL